VNATTTSSVGGQGAGEGIRGAKWAEKLKMLEGNETLMAECAAKASGGSGAAGGGGGGKFFATVPVGGLDGLLTGGQ